MQMSNSTQKQIFYLLKYLMKPSDTWVRLESQQRGQAHLHNLNVVACSRIIVQNGIPDCFLLTTTCSNQQQQQQQQQQQRRQRQQLLQQQQQINVDGLDDLPALESLDESDEDGEHEHEQFEIVD